MAEQLLLVFSMRGGFHKLLVIVALHLSICRAGDIALLHLRTWYQCGYTLDCVLRTLSCLGLVVFNSIGITGSTLALERAAEYLLTDTLEKDLDNVLSVGHSQNLHSFFLCVFKDSEERVILT